MSGELKDGRRVTVYPHNDRTGVGINRDEGNSDIIPD
jgi:hypothetical protein